MRAPFAWVLLSHDNPFPWLRFSHGFVEFEGDGIVLFLSNGTGAFVRLKFPQDIIVDVAPQVRRVHENGHKNLKVIVEVDDELDAQKVYEQESKCRRKFLGS